jgi:hypothetical protein
MSHNAIFKAIVEHDGSLVAALAVLAHGPARFFVRQNEETPDAFIGRVSNWAKQQGAEGVEIREPDVLPEGAVPADVLAQLVTSLGGPTGDIQAGFDVAQATLRWLDPEGNPAN